MPKIKLFTLSEGVNSKLFLHRSKNRTFLMFYPPPLVKILYAPLKMSAGTTNILKYFFWSQVPLLTHLLGQRRITFYFVLKSTILHTMSSTTFSIVFVSYTVSTLLSSFCKELMLYYTTDFFDFYVYLFVCLFSSFLIC